MDTIINIFEEKGWALYEVTKDTHVDLEKIILTGRTKDFESNKYYTILPFVANSKNLNEIIEHLKVVEETNQSPKYNTGEQTFILDGLECVDDVFYLHPSHTPDFRIKVNRDNIERTIQLGISNYNTFFFSSIDELLKVVSSPTQQESTLLKDVRWQLLQKDNSDLLILHPSEPISVLFRGQNTRYQPCFPSLCREIVINSTKLKDLTHSDQILFVVRLIKTAWFCSLLEETPHFQWCKEQTIWMDKMALAQHYEMPTGFIDLTQSVDVASFFACCKQNEDGTWSPMTSGKGIIYSLDYRLVPMEISKIKAIGQQAFPRPSEQWGWTYEMNLNENFDLLPYVRKYIFLHNEKSSQEILNKFSSGNDLFPQDPLYCLAKEIKDSKELPSNIINIVLDDLINDEYGLMGISKADLVKEISFHYKVLDKVEIMEQKLMDNLIQSWDKRKTDFINNIDFVFGVVSTKE